MKSCIPGNFKLCSALPKNTFCLYKKIKLDLGLDYKCVSCGTLRSLYRTQDRSPEGGLLVHQSIEQLGPCSVNLQSHNNTQIGPRAFQNDQGGVPPSLEKLMHKETRATMLVILPTHLEKTKCPSRREWMQYHRLILNMKWINLIYLDGEKYISEIRLSDRSKLENE